MFELIFVICISSGGCQQLVARPDAGYFETEETCTAMAVEAGARIVDTLRDNEIASATVKAYCVKAKVGGLD